MFFNLLFSSDIDFYIIHNLFLTIVCKLSYSIDKLYPAAFSLLITVQWLTVI